MFAYRICLVMYMKVWPSTVDSISENLIQSNSARPHWNVDYGIPHGNITTLAAILSCRSWHLRISHTMLNASSPERWRRAHLLGFAVLMVIGLPGSFDCEREFKARNLRQEQNDLPIHYEHTLSTAADGFKEVSLASIGTMCGWLSVFIRSASLVLGTSLELSA